MILLDSSFIVAYSNEADENHAKALQLAKDIDGGKYGAVAITDYIFDEVVTVMLIKTKDLGRVAELGEALLNAALLFRIGEDIFDLAWKTFKEQQAQRLSFTDCTSIVACRTNGISNVATFDRGLQRLREFNVLEP